MPSSLSLYRRLLIAPFIVPLALSAGPLEMESKSASTVTAQKTEGMVPPDIAGFGVGKPSFSVDTIYSDDMDFEDGSDSLGLKNLRARIPLFGLPAGDFRFSVSARYDFTELDSQALGNRHLHDISLGLQLSRAPDDVEQGWLGFLRLQPSAGFESGADFGEAFEMTAIGVVGYKFSESFALAGGVYAKYAYEDFTIYPSFGFIWRPSDNTFVQITPPLVNLAWRVAPKWTLFVNTYPAGNKWRLDGDDGEGEVQEIDLSLFHASAGVQYAVTEQLRLSIRGGVNFLSSLEIRDSEHRVLDDDDLDSSPFAAATLTWVF